MQAGAKETARTAKAARAAMAAKAPGALIGGLKGAANSARKNFPLKIGLFYFFLKKSIYTVIHVNLRQTLRHNKKALKKISTP